MARINDGKGIYESATRTISIPLEMLNEIFTQLEVVDKRNKQAILSSSDGSLLDLYSSVNDLKECCRTCI